MFTNGNIVPYKQGTEFLYFLYCGDDKRVEELERLI